MLQERVSSHIYSEKYTEVWNIPTDDLASSSNHMSSISDMAPSSLKPF